MLTMLLLDDEYRVYELLARALHNKGYVCAMDAHSAGVVKVERETKSDSSVPSEVTFTMTDPLRESKGHLYKSTLSGIEKPLIESVLRHTESNQLKAARILGINRNTLRSKMKKLSIDPKKWKD